MSPRSGLVLFPEGRRVFLDVWKWDETLQVCQRGGEKEITRAHSSHLLFPAFFFFADLFLEGLT